MSNSYTELDSRGNRNKTLLVSSIDSDEERVMHSKIDNIEIMINDEADEVIVELFKSLKNWYQRIWN